MTTSKDVFSRIITAVRQQWKTHRYIFLIIMLILRALSTIIGYQLETYVLTTGRLESLQSSGFTGPYMPFEEIMQSIPQIPTYVMMLFLMIAILFIVAHIFVLFLVFAPEEPSKMSYQAYLQKSFFKLFYYIGTDFIQSIFLVILFLLLIIPGIVFSVFRAFTLMVVVNESTYFRSALKRSYQLVKGRRRKTISIFFLLILIMILMQGVGAAIASTIQIATGSLVVGEAIDGMLSILFQLFWWTAMGCFYLEWKATEKNQDLSNKHLYQHMHQE